MSRTVARPPNAELVRQTLAIWEEADDWMHTVAIANALGVHSNAALQGLRWLNQYARLVHRYRPVATDRFKWPPTSWRLCPHQAANAAAWEAGSLG